MLILEAGEVGARIPCSDRRVQHASRVLKKGPGDTLLAGIAGADIGTARVESCDGDGWVFSFESAGRPEALAPLTLLVGFPRPIQANRILKDLTSLGASRIVLSGTELGEKSYIQSDFFSKREFRPALLEGAEQAANPLLPRVDCAWTLGRALDALGEDGEGLRFALDPYRSRDSLGSLAAAALASPQEAPCVLAIGSERGWTEGELALLEARGFRFATLGRRILKTETACMAAASIALSAMGYL